jgi:hypothetical protein
MSEASCVFDSQRLKPIIAELASQSGAVDSTDNSLVKWRLHTHFEIDRYVPTRIDVTPDGRGDNEERPVLERSLESDRLYVMDRGYVKFALFNKIVQAKRSYVCRLKDNSVYDVVEDRDLSQADLDAGVLSDQIISIGQSKKKSDRPDHKVRLICVKCSPHTSRGRYKGTSTGPSSDGILRIATNLLDVPAEIIACMLINFWTVRKPTKRTFEMISYFFTGLASEAELVAHLEKLKQHDAAKSKTS